MRKFFDVSTPNTVLSFQSKDFNKIPDSFRSNDIIKNKHFTTNLKNVKMYWYGFTELV